MKNPSSLLNKIEKRKQEGLFRELTLFSSGVDFYSNDYLGFSKIIDNYKLNHDLGSGSTGSRLISGNSKQALETEKLVADFFDAETALLFNSGYDANIGLLSAIGGRNDVFLMDELCHASMYDGCRLSFSKTYKFRHNDVQHLKQLVEKNKTADTIYILLESVYSMDGDCAPIDEMVESIDEKNVYFILDEAHATGVVGNYGKGLVSALNLENKIYARIHTFGKAMGCHGACVLGSKELVNYLINFARSFIYTTALPPSSLSAIQSSIEELRRTDQILILNTKINFFREQVKNMEKWIPSSSAVQSFIYKGNDKVDRVSKICKENNFLVKAIKSPTVAKNQERVRICLHSFNTFEEIKQLVDIIKTLN